ncbi:MAG TPA: hypothetical protein DDZ84_03015 [Firmicutes bacterium]|nr:hypothetical protein [Bacillota bacterium]
MPNRRMAQRLVEGYLCYGQCIGRLTQAVYVMFALGPEIAQYGGLRCARAAGAKRDAAAAP